MYAIEEQSWPPTVMFWPRLSSKALLQSSTYGPAICKLGPNPVPKTVMRIASFAAGTRAGDIPVTACVR